jgi:uncharacterized cupredoxin-like copper-binding protein
LSPDRVAAKVTRTADADMTDGMRFTHFGIHVNKATRSASSSRTRPAQARVLWRFTTAGKVCFTFLQPGRYDAGMKGAITLAA